MKLKKIYTLIIGMLVLVSVLGVFSSLPMTATMTQPDTISKDNIVITPDKSLSIIKSLPTCTLKITDVYGTQSASTSYAKVIVEGFSEGCYKVEVTINCAGNEQSQSVSVDRSGFWQATFDGTRSECICYKTPITVKAWCVDPAGVDCRDVWELPELPCRVVEGKCNIGIEEVFGVGTVPGTPYVEKIHVRGVARGCELVEVIVKCNSPYELRARAIVDPTTGRWEAILEADVAAECVCGKLIEITACCIVPYLPNCCAYLKLEQLPCPTPTECGIRIEGVYPEYDPATGNVRTMIVWGIAKGCKTVQVMIVCGARQAEITDVDPAGHWKVALNGILAECLCKGSVYVEACCIDPPEVKCCDFLKLESLPCLESPPETCYIEILDVFGVPRAVAAGVNVHVRGIAKGCRIVEVIINCAGQEVRTRTEVDPATGRWEAILDGLLAECECGQKIVVRACCLIPERADCCDIWERDAFPCPKPEECQIWVEGVHPELDPDDPNRILHVIVVGAAKGCMKVQVFMNCVGNEQMETAEVIDGYWRVILDGITAECFCDTPITVKACCLDEAGNFICCDELMLERFPCPEIPPKEECFVRIVDVYGEPMVTAAGVRVYVRGIAEGCRVVEVAIICGAEFRTQVEVDPVTWRWEAVLDGLQADCQCNRKIIVKACCLIPEQAECCDIWDLDALPCPSPEECRIWIEGVYPEYDPVSATRQIHKVIIVGSAKGCKTVQVFMNCAGNEQIELTEVYDTGEWKVVLDGIAAECFCNRFIYVEACCIDAAGNILCCDALKLERLQCPEIPPEEECFVKIVDVYGEPMVTAAGVRVYVRGIAEGCRVVEVAFICGTEYRAKAEVDPVTGRWEAILDGLQAECQCEQKFTVKACCIIPERADCCDAWERDALPCPSPEECRIWIKGVYPELDPTDSVARRVHNVIIWGSAIGCTKIRVVMNCAGEEQVATAEVDSDGHWKVALDGIPAECFCGETRIFIEACCEEAPNCCDFLELEILPCPERPPVTTPIEPMECYVEILEVIPEFEVNEAGEEVLTRITVVGRANECWKVEVRLACREKLGTAVEVIDGEWKVVFEDVQEICVCGEHLEVTVICVDSAISGCFDTIILEDACKPREVTTKSEEPPTESETRPSFIPGFGLIEALFAVLALLGLTKLRHTRR